MSTAPSVVVTFFKHYAATTKHEDAYALEALATRICTVTATTKAKLPWLKCARFGDLRSETNGLRHDGNVLACTACIVIQCPSAPSDRSPLLAAAVALDA